MRSRKLTVPALSLATSVVLALSACSDDSSPEASDNSATTAPPVAVTSVDAKAESEDNSSSFVFMTETVVEDAPEPEPVAEEPEQEPVLGHINLNSVDGFGTVRPSSFTNGSMCSSLMIYDATWNSWGGETATGMGTQCVPAGMMEETPPHPESITASDLGDCAGIYAYRMLQVGDGDPFSICIP